LLAHVADDLLLSEEEDAVGSGAHKAERVLQEIDCLLAD